MQLQLNMQMRFVVARLEAVLEARLAQVGPVSCAQEDFIINQADFRHTSGVYMLGDMLRITYVGQSKDSVGHRTFQRLQAIQTGQYGIMEVSMVLGLHVSPQFAPSLEWITVMVYRLLFGRLPVMNKKMPPRPADWRLWLPRLHRTN